MRDNNLSSLSGSTCLPRDRLRRQRIMKMGGSYARILLFDTACRR